MTGSSPASPQPSEDRRARDRPRCLLGCKIMHGPWGETVDGVIRNLHADGARIRLLEPTAVAGQLSILIERSGQVHQARVVWRRDGQLGVVFEAGELGPVKTQVETLRRLARQMSGGRSRAPEDGRY